MSGLGSDTLFFKRSSFKSKLKSPCILSSITIIFIYAAICFEQDEKKIKKTIEANFIGIYGRKNGGNYYLALINVIFENFSRNIMQIVKNTNPNQNPGGQWVMIFYCRTMDLVGVNVQ